MGTMHGIVCALVICGNAHAQQDLYVAPSGVDGTNDCLSAGNPCATIAHAVSNSIAGSGNGDTIHVAAGTYTEPEIVLDRGSFGLAVTLAGAGASSTLVQAAASPGIATTRVLRVSLNTVATISGMTLRHGNTPDGDVGGGADKLGGGILVNGSLLLSDCIIAENRTGRGGDAEDGGAGWGGGGIYTDGSLVISNCLLIGNRTGAGGAGNGGSPQGRGGTGGHGGAILNSGGSVVIVQSAIVSNRAGAGGSGTVTGGMGGAGAIWNSGSLRIVNSTISGNAAGDGGGGGTAGGGGGRAGAIWCAPLSTATVAHATLAWNTAGAGGTGTVAGTAGSGGGIDGNAADVRLSHVALVSNRVFAGGVGPDAAMAFTSVVYSLVSDTNGWSVGETPTGLIAGVDAILGALADHGGNTPAHRPGILSPLLEAGDPAAPFLPETDQRGLPRVGGWKPDIGAYEEQPDLRHVAVGGSDVTNDCRDSSAPCATVAYAVSIAIPGDIVHVATGAHLVANIPLLSTITISGDGVGTSVLQAAASSGAATTRLFSVGAAATVTVRHATLRFGRAATGDAGQPGEDGGGIANSGSLFVIDAIIEDCAAGDGGAGDESTSGGEGGRGGAIFSEGFLVISGAVFRGNSAGTGGDGSSGGGGGSGGAIHDAGTGLRLYESLVVSNAAGSGGEDVIADGGEGGAGGGIYTAGDAEVDRARIMANVAGSGGVGGENGGDAGVGGGIAVVGNAVISRSLLDANVAGTAGSGDPDDGEPGSGGGMHCSGSAEIVGSTISGNAAASGAGVLSVGTIAITHSTIAGNIADNEGGGLSRLAGAASIGHTIVADNGDGGTAADILGSVVSLDFNLVGDTNGLVIASGSDSGSISEMNPLIAALEDLGDGIPVHRLLDGSPAIDAGDPSFQPPPATDQRGSQRVEGGRIDIGAYETPDPDDDGDGMPDEWEQQYGFDPFDPGITNALAGPGGDADDDRHSNLDEFVALTNPTDADDYFRVAGFTRTNVWRVLFLSRTGRVYTLAGTTGAGNPAWTNVSGATDVPGTDSGLALEQAPGPGPSIFRLQVRLP